MQHVVGWGFPVVIADNGFLDILLHVGILGFIPFLGVLIVAFVRSGKFAFRNPSLINFFPLLLMVYAVIANISFSLFLETETFIWLVIVASLFVVTRQPRTTIAS
jgi:O-antigen ligase